MALFLMLATPVVAVAVLLCAPSYGVRFVLTVLAHMIVAVALLAAWGLGTIGLMVDCGSGSDAKTCAWVTALFLAAPALLIAQLSIGLGSMWAEWPPMRWVRRFGSLAAVLGVSLLAFGWFGPHEALLPSAAPGEAHSRAAEG